MRTRFLICVMVIVCAAGLQAAHRLDPSRGITLTNSHVRFEFEPNGMGLSAMVDLHSGTNHIQPVKEKHLLWEIALGRGTLIKKLNNNDAPCNYASLEELPGGVQRLVMEWNDLRWWKENRVLTVRATVDLPPVSGIAKWRIFVDNKSDYWGLWSVTFPFVTGFPEAGKYDLARPVFGSGGQLLRAWSGKIQARNPAGNWPMQFLALSRNHDSVYLGTRDSSGYAKDFVVNSDEKVISMVHYPEGMGVAGSDYPDYYPVELGVYQGRWLEAAQHYRAWALKQKWVQAGKLSQRTDFPEILKNVGVWILGDWEWAGAAGSPQQMDAPLLQAQKTLGVPIGLHWYNWHHMKFDNEYPHFLPPKPEFAERVKDLVRHGVLVMPYINGSSADFNIPDFDKFAPHAIVDEAGGYRMHFYGAKSGRLLSMCPTQEYWQNTISSLVQSLVEDYGVNGVYIDQITAMEHELCFSKSHGHPVGGGRYWVDGNRELLAKVRDTSEREGRRPVITSEGTDEVFMDLVDGYLTWAQPSDREIPMMEVVYSGYTLFFGSPCDFTKSDPYFCYAQGQALMDGRQNGWMSLDLFKPEYSAKAGYLRQCGRYRVATKQYLLYGRLLGPIEPENPVATFTEEGFGFNKDIHKGTAPVAEGRLWQDEQGHLAVFLANYIDKPVEFKYRVDPAKYGLSGKRFELKQITPEGSRPISTVTGTVQRSESLGPREIKVIEIAPTGAAAVHRGFGAANHASRGAQNRVRVSLPVHHAAVLLGGSR